MVEIGGLRRAERARPTLHTQVTKVTGAQTILFIPGQLAYDDTGPATGTLRRRGRAAGMAGRDRRPSRCCSTTGG